MNEPGASAATVTAMSGVPTLTDGTVTLRGHTDADARGSYEQCQDPLSQQWTTVPIPYSLDDAKRFVRQIMPGGWDAGQEWGFAVEVEGRYAGTVSLRPEGEARAEVAYGSHPWVRGLGHMEAALRLLLAWGFEEQGLETVIWWANRGNWASRRLAWKLGFTLEGTVRRWLPQRGELLDAWVGTLLRDDPRSPSTPWYDVPVLAADGLVLRAMTEADVPRVVENCNDPETLRWVGAMPLGYTAQQAAASLEGLALQRATGAGITWAVADPDTDVLLAWASLFDLVPGEEAEVGYLVHPDGRGRGVARRATEALVRHAFLELGVRRVKAMTAVDNTASRRVLEACGFTHTGLERRGVEVRDDRADAALYDLLREEWDATHA